MAGAKPVFVDVDEFLCLNTELVKKAITSKTKAVIHVSINGRAGDLNNLNNLCRNKKVRLIEDAAQSLGSFHNGKHLGLFGEIGSFSFSVPKIITTGQGGALITDSKELYDKIEKLKDFGRVKAGVDSHDAMGWNFKFTDFQAVLGIEQMKKLPERAKRKKAMLALYRKLLKGVKEVKFIETSSETSPWFIDVLVPDPKVLRDHLKERGIGSRLFYPAVHTQPIYKNVKGKFPVATSVGSHGLWLPSSSFLKDSDIKLICKEITGFYKQNHE
jgi:perosamine synthetase